MKKQYLFLILFIIQFSFCYSQNNYPGYHDTIFKDRGGKEIVCKIVRVDKYYTYYKPASDTNKQKKMELWRIRDIHYGTARPSEIIQQTNKQLDIPDKPDTTPQLFFGQVNASYEFPTGNLPPIGDGGHIDLTMEYFFAPQTAVVLMGGADAHVADRINDFFQANYTIEECFGGLTFRLGDNRKVSKKNPVPGAPWIDFTAMGGLVIAQNPKLYSTSYDANTLTSLFITADAGTGYGFGSYFSIQSNVITKHKRVFSIGIGYLYSALTYNHFTYTFSVSPPSPGAPPSIQIVEPTKFYLGLIRPYIGVGF